MFCFDVIVKCCMPYETLDDSSSAWEYMPSEKKEPPKEADMWTALQRISSEIEYRTGITQQTSTFTEIRVQIMPILRVLAKYHVIDILHLNRELSERNLLMHLYATPVEPGMQAKDLRSKFLKRNIIKVYPGTVAMFQSFVKETLKITPEELFARLRDCGFEERVE